MLDQLTEGVAWWLVFVYSATLHEAGHAWSALKLGDRTAYLGGQVTLNPLPHILREPFGMVAVPLLTSIWLGFPLGWASAPYDPAWALHHPRRASLMALCGPLSNLLLAILVAGIMVLGLRQGWFIVPEESKHSLIVDAPQGDLAFAAAKALSMTFFLNLLLFVWNLFPVPPLDGAAVLGLFFRPTWVAQYLFYVAQMPFNLMAFFFAYHFFQHVFSACFLWSRVAIYTLGH